MRYLFLSPHPDDIELTCGATISRLTREGNDVTVAVFSDCDLPESLEDASRAHDILNVGSTRYLHYPQRDFGTYRQDILNDIIRLRDAVHPDVVFIPDFESDIHQDHMVIGMEGLRAFKMTADIIGYSHSHNQVRNGNNYFIPVVFLDVEKKLEAIKCFTSEQERYYFNKETVIGIMRYYGVQCESEYAEAFRMIRMTKR